jgi:hypothetical protein
VYWLTRERLCTEAELACDEWAIRTVPDGRVSYAEALLDVCRTLSTTTSPAPALGVAGAGRFLERRVNMILQNHAPSRISVPVLLGAGLLALLALPGWSAAGTPPTKSSDSATSASKEHEYLVASATDEKVNDVASVDDDEKDADDDDKDAKATKAEIAKELKKALGPGSDFEKEMKNLGVELKKELGPGSDFEKEMKNLATDLAKELGPGSDFQKDILSKTKEIEKKFGPGSDFEKKMQRLGEKMAAKYGEGSEFAEKMKKAEKDAKAVKTSSDTSSDKKAKTKTRKKTLKARAAKALKAQIDELNAQLKKLEEPDGEEND